jgi:hypothetical protein
VCVWGEGVIGETMGLGSNRMSKSSGEGAITPSFKAKTECISLCVLGSSFTNKARNGEINNITNVYYIESYYKSLLQVQKD